jgi:hypothetical protein
MITSRSYIGNVLVEKGARVYTPTNLDGGFKLRFEAVCDDDAGKSWHAEVHLGGELVLSTASFDDPYKAVREAERTLTARLAALLRG